MGKYAWYVGSVSGHAEGEDFPALEKDVEVEVHWIGSNERSGAWVVFELKDNQLLYFIFGMENAYPRNLIQNIVSGIRGGGRYWGRQGQPRYCEDGDDRFVHCGELLT